MITETLKSGKTTKSIFALIFIQPPAARAFYGKMEKWKRRRAPTLAVWHTFPLYATAVSAVSDGFSMAAASAASGCFISFLWSGSKLSTTAYRPAPRLGNPDFYRGNPDFYHGNPDFYRGNPDFYHGNPNFYHGNPDFYHGNPDFYHGNPDFYHGNPDFYHGNPDFQGKNTGG
jgi:hypothetical protein